MMSFLHLLLHMFTFIMDHPYNIATSLLRHYYIHYYVLLQNHYYVLLRHYYVIVTSIITYYNKWGNYVTMGSLLHIITFVVSIILSLLPIFTIITYYYIFVTGQLADECR